MKLMAWMGWHPPAALAVMLLCAAGADANNLQISNVTALPGAGVPTVQFDISWENSWRRDTDDCPAYLHDAAWVFFKVLPESESAWKHLVLQTAGTNPANFATGTAGAGVELIVPQDRMGVFIRRSASNTGTGTLSSANVRVCWNMAQNGVLRTDKVRLGALGVEMVYVAEGEFWFGDGITARNRDFVTLINTTNATLAPTNVGDYYSGGYPMGGTAPASPSWPNGYRAFYMMKYMLTQGQYVDFANMLATAEQATNRVVTSVTNMARNTLYGSWTNFLPGAATRAFLMRWEDGVAFTDWSGLRPFTELEYEKACRGPLQPVGNEFAWGTTGIVLRTSTVGVDGSGTETYLPTSANCYAIGIYGLRVGVFASPESTREEAGASYWGIMDLTGNTFERAISQTLTTFTGLHGDGALTSMGDADVSGWPIGTGNNMVDGAGYRGGPYSVYNRLMTSDRGYAGAGASYTIGILSPGWRGARTAP